MFFKLNTPAQLIKFARSGADFRCLHHSRRVGAEVGPLLELCHGELIHHRWRGHSAIQPRATRCTAGA